MPYHPHRQAAEQRHRAKNRTACRCTLHADLPEPTRLQPGYFAPERMTRIAEDSSAGMVYSDWAIRNGVKSNHPVIDYRRGACATISASAAAALPHSGTQRAAGRMAASSYRYAGLYDLRLKVSQQHPLVHINSTSTARSKRTTGPRARRSSITWTLKTGSGSSRWSRPARSI